MKNLLLITMLLGIGYSQDCEVGDVNGDGSINVQDIVLIVNMILGN